MSLARCRWRNLPSGHATTPTVWNLTVELAFYSAAVQALTNKIKDSSGGALSRD